MDSNLFSECRNTDELFRVLREDLEQLRGEPFKKWEVRTCWVDVSRELLHFSLATSYTPSSGVYGLSWYAIAEAEDLERAAHVPLRDRTQGYGVFVASTGHNDGDVYVVYVHMELRHAPQIQRLVRRTVQLARLRAKALMDDEVIQSLKADVELTNMKIARRVDEVNSMFDKKHAKDLARAKELPW